jgi:uncharacterized membrane protein YphA (DoxX/SURF4 family)
MSASPQAWGLTALRLCLGVFFLFQGISMLGWLGDRSPLAAQLTGYLQSANDWNRWYLERVCIPGAPIVARLVLFGELATAVSLITGVYTRYAAAAAFLMVLNIQFASGQLFDYRFLTNGYCLPVLGGLLALAIGGASLPLSLRRK